MGATDFTRIGYGSTAEDAFRNAQRAADAEVGHQEGYSGDINCKSSFVMISTDFEAAKAKLLGQSENPPAYLQRWIAAANTPLKQLEVCVEAAKLDPDLDDKWGPAGCVEIKPGKYYFFGVAPE